MCEQCQAPDVGPARTRSGIVASTVSRRRMLRGVGAGIGAVALTAAGGLGTAAAASLKNGSWCNPAQGYFPDGGHFGAPRGNASHAGQDVTNSTGTAIYAAAAGTVYAVGEGLLTGRTGNGIIVFHGTHYTYYGHLNRYRVSDGASVSAGQWIADMGATGNVTGPHLHFETHQSGLGSVVDPVEFMTNRGVDLGGGWSALDPAASGARVRVFQHLLRHRGSSISVSGEHDSSSVSAVESFQDGSGMVADGQVGPKTWPKLVVTCESGDDGEQVKAAQVALNKHSASLRVDGEFGSVTDDAVRSFQNVNRLVVDGECGPITWQALVS